MPEPGKRNLPNFFQTPIKALPLDVIDSGHVSFQIRAKALDFVRKELKSTALVGGSGGPMLFKLNDWLEIESNGGDLWLEDPNEIGSDGFYKVDDNRLWGN
jgi:hypothetical protein